MIRGIPNQPIDFVGDDLVTCEPEIISPLLVSQEDSLLFQFEFERCEDAEPLLPETFVSGWVFDGLWTLNINLACCGPDQDGASISHPLTTVLGQMYQIEINVQSISGSGAEFSIGGVTTIINAPGFHVFIVSAIADADPTLTLIDSGSAICVTSINVYEVGDSLTVALIAEDETELFTANLGDDPQYFELSGTTMKVIIPMVEAPDAQCFKVMVTDGCDGEYVENTELCSQTITVADDCTGTIKMRVCIDHDQPEMGFVAGYFEMRVPALVIRSKWSYDNDEERLTNGYINRHRIDRRSERQLRITDPHIGYAAHSFLSALSMFDHFYIGTQEYSVEVEEYEPNYPDTQQNTGPIQLTIRPKQELFRKTLCEPVGEGCNPLNDPICPVPNVVVDIALEEGGMFSVGALLVSNLGFISDKLIYTKNGSSTEYDFSEAGTEIDLGSISPGQVFTVTVTNSADSACNWSQQYSAPCQCTDAALVMWLNGSASPSNAFTTSEGVQAVAVECQNGRPAWEVNGGAIAGGIKISWDGEKWLALDIDGNGFIAQPNVLFRTPCEVTQWFTTEDGETATGMASVTFCGGGGEECCTIGFTLTSGSVTDTYTEQFTLNGRPVYVRNGYEDTANASNLVWCVVWTDDGGIGFGWHVSNLTLDVLYFSDEDVPTPDLVSTWIAVESGGEEPVPVISDFGCV